MAVLAVWDKLVSGCISLRTGKLTANSSFSGLFSNSETEPTLQN
jgi:hypothetical protein